MARKEQEKKKEVNKLAVLKVNYLKTVIHLPTLSFGQFGNLRTVLLGFGILWKRNRGK